MYRFDFKRFRKDKNLKQIEIANMLNCNQSFISLLDNGTRPTPATMIDILRRYYSDVDDYITSEYNKVQTITGSCNNIAGNGINVNSGDVMQRTLDEFAAMRVLLEEQIQNNGKLIATNAKLVENNQTQFDRLMKLLER